MNKSRRALSVASTMLLCVPASHAADVVPVNFDDPDEGYNDPAPATPLGGNPGTTLGEQRRIVAQFAADLWGSVLVSDQPVFVGAQFNPLGPNVLGSAGATFVFSDFAPGRSVEHTSDIQSLMRNSYAAFRLNKKKLLCYL